MLFCACAASIVLTTAVIYIPFLASAFEFASLGIFEYTVSMLLALCIIPIVETVKAIQRRKNK